MVNTDEQTHFDKHSDLETQFRGVSETAVRENPSRLALKGE